MFLNPMLENGDVQYCLRNERSGTVLATRLEAAFDSGSRRHGLLGRARLDEDAALVLAPCNAIHTLFMRFPIDVIFVARDGSVVKLRERVAAWRVAIGWRAFAVIECSSGVILRSGTRTGDRLAVVPVRPPGLGN